MSGPSASESGAGARREREWQLAPRELDAVRTWLREHDHGVGDGLHIEALPTLALHDRYLDTDTWTILRAGFALRVRHRGDGTEATLKALGESQDGFIDRFESTQPLTSAEIESLAAADGPVASRVRELAGAESLGVLFEAWTRRERFAVIGQSGPVAEIALDESRLGRADGPEPTTLQRIEVETVGKGHPALPTIVAEMRSACELVPAPTTKFQAGLLAAGLTPKASGDAAAPALTPDMSIAQAALVVLRARLEAFREHEPAVRLGDDANDLHDLRVAVRRLAVSLRVFADHLPARARRLAGGVQHVMRALGEVRDFDVQLAAIDSFAQELEEPLRPALHPLRERLLAERSRTRRRMVRVLDSKTRQRVLEQLAVLATTPPSTRRRSTTLASVAPQLAKRRYRKLKRAAERAAADASPEALHKVRTSAKKIRYLLEPLEGVYGEPVNAYLHALRRLQNVLGESQDAHVRAQRLAALAAAPTRRMPGETLFVMGRMVERAAQLEARTRKRLAREERRVRGKRWKALRGAMLKLEAKRPEA